MFCYLPYKSLCVQASARSALEPLAAFAQKKKKKVLVGLCSNF